MGTFRLMQTFRLPIALAVGLSAGLVGCSGSQKSADAPASQELEASSAGEEYEDSNSAEEIDGAETFAKTVPDFENQTNEGKDASVAAIKPPAKTPKDQLDHMEIGESAVFESYSITLNSISIDGSSVIAEVSMDAYKDSIFATRYMEAHPEKGASFDPVAQDDVKVDAGETYAATLVYERTDIEMLRWNNWSNEAEWHLDIGGVPANQAAESEEQLTEDYEANRVVKSFNRRYPEEGITKEQIYTYDTAAGKGSQITLGDIIFEVGISDGSPFYTVLSQLEVNDSNKAYFFDVCEKIVCAVYDLEEEEVDALLQELSDGARYVRLEKDASVKRYDDQMIYYSEETRDGNFVLHFFEDKF